MPRQRKKTAEDLSHDVQHGGMAEYTANEHHQDADCTLDENNVCSLCNVIHGEPCLQCSGRGFHVDDCPRIDDQKRADHASPEPGDYVPADLDALIEDAMLADGVNALHVRDLRRIKRDYDGIQYQLEREQDLNIEARLQLSETIKRLRGLLAFHAQETRYRGTDTCPGTRHVGSVTDCPACIAAGWLAVLDKRGA